MNDEENKQTETASSKLIETVERLEKANKEAQEVIRKQEELIALNLLGGKSDTGKQPEPAKVESAEEYAKRIMGSKI
jgi:hypothetical protein